MDLPPPRSDMRSIALAASSSRLSRAFKSDRWGSTTTKETWTDAAATTARGAVHRGIGSGFLVLRKADDSRARAGPRCPRGLSRQLRYLTITDPEAQPMRPEVGKPNSIASDVLC